jgi:hypothetical protein
VQSHGGADLGGHQEVEESEDVGGRGCDLEPVVAGQAERCDPVPSGLVHRPVRVPDGLGHPGRARAEDEHRLRVVVAALVDRLARVADVDGVEIDHWDQRSQHLDRGAVGDGEDRIGQPHGVRDLGGLPAGVDQHRSRADLAQRVDGDDEFDAVGGHHQHPSTGLRPLVQQTSAVGVAQPVEVGERPRRITCERGGVVGDASRRIDEAVVQQSSHGSPITAAGGAQTLRR